MTGFTRRGWVLSAGALATSAAAIRLLRAQPAAGDPPAATPPGFRPDEPGSDFDGIAATRGRALTAESRNVQRINSRTTHFAVGQIRQLKIAFGNFRLLDDPAEVRGAGTCTLSAAVEYPKGRITPLAFGGGAPTATIPDGGLVLSDFTSGNLRIPDGAPFWIRIFARWTNYVIYNDWQNVGLGDQFETGPSVDDKTLGGTIESPWNNSVPPLAIIGRGTTAASVCVIGDSKALGVGDASDRGRSDAGPGLYGEIARSFQPNLPSARFPDGLAFLNLSTGSSSAADWIANAPARRLLYPFCTHFIVQLGFNDILTLRHGAHRCRDDMVKLVADIAAAAPPSARFTNATVTPKSSSSDGWMTLAGQSTDGSNPERAAFNRLVRTARISDRIDNGFIELADIVEQQRDSGLWKPAALLGGKPWTADGIHESADAYRMIQSSHAVDPARLVAKGDQPTGTASRRSAARDASSR